LIVTPLPDTAAGASELVFRVATSEDVARIASWNQQLIADEGAGSAMDAMSVDQLESRMRTWLSGDYRALVFEERATPTSAAVAVAYALIRDTREWIHLRQFFVVRNRRRRGIGARAVALLRERVFEHDKPVIVEAMTWNHAALSFWRAVGFADRYVGLESRSGASGPRSSSGAAS
jgi:GNAT superfamily N-acetyltransferase